MLSKLLLLFSFLFLLIKINKVYCNLKYITGTQRPIQLFLNKQYLQILPNGVINGTSNSNSMYTVIRRKSFRRSIITLQNPITCMYVCMDKCGFHYGSKILSKDCFFEEIIEENNYNTYSRVYNKKRTYLAFNNYGHSRRTQLPIGRPLFKMATYVLTLLKRLNNDIYTMCPSFNSIILQHRKCKL